MRRHGTDRCRRQGGFLEHLPFKAFTECFGFNQNLTDHGGAISYVVRETDGVSLTFKHLDDPNRVVHRGDDSLDGLQEVRGILPQRFIVGCRVALRNTRPKLLCSSDGAQEKLKDVFKFPDGAHRLMFALPRCNQ